MNVPPSVRWRLVWTIFCKEITEALRDRMTRRCPVGLMSLTGQGARLFRKPM